ncbi:MAG: RNase H family protein [Solirubrobacteraceae bacterium]|jgi:ribonuclease HI
MPVSPRRRSNSLPGHLPHAAPGEVLVWTDGACQRNPGPGGWAAVACWEDGVVEEHSGGLAHTTNNVMEMTAALEGLRALPPGRGPAS